MNRNQELSLKQIDEGRKKALDNACDLFKDAKILLENERYARALFLSQIATEELGKYIMLISTAVKVVYEEVEREWKEFWTGYKTHKIKSGKVLIIEDFFLSDKKFSECFDDSFKQREIYEIAKMSSLYSDFHEDRFCSPMELIDEKTANLAVNVTEKRVKWIKSYDENIIREDGLLKLRKETVEEFYEKMGIKELFDLKNKGKSARRTG
jgi:AbiV family abortive infection protein